MIGDDILLRAIKRFLFLVFKCRLTANYCCLTSFEFIHSEARDTRAINLAQVFEQVSMIMCSHIVRILFVNT